MNRLAALPTHRIDPLKALPFRYKNKALTGCAGDTIATALYANGFRIFSRSVKYHRPRGLYSLDGESSNTFMSVNGIPNVCAEKTALQAGMVVKAQNVKGTPEFDLMGAMNSLDWAMPAGFYYKTMHKPAALWPTALKQIRKVAGSGVINPDFTLPGYYDEIYPHADVCIIGGGPAGMSAALAAAEAGLQVIILESRPHLGGIFDYRDAPYDKGVRLYQRSRELADKLESYANVRIFTRSAMVGAYTDNLITAIQTGAPDASYTERYVEIRAKSVVIATGCIERPLLFENNEKPGIMQIGCAHRLARTYGLLETGEVVFSIGHDLGLEAAVDLHDLGMQVACVADMREDGQDPVLVEALKQRQIPFFKGWVAREAQGCNRITRITLSTLQGTFEKTMPCSQLVTSAGMTPSTGPLSLLHAKLEYDAHTGFFLPVQLPPQVHTAGRLLGFDHPEAIEASGHLAGLAAAADCGIDTRETHRQNTDTLAALPGPSKGCRLLTAPVSGRKSFICFDEDTTVKNIKQAVGMGLHATELIKRYTAAGTGPGQSGIPGHNLPLLMAQFHGGAGVSAKPTTVRAPLTGALIATYAGRNHDMSKRTPMHNVQKRDGGIMRRIGVWNRARYFSHDFSCRNEILNVRNNVGMFDATTLGKFKIWGPDALKALQRVYVNKMSNVFEGKIKYAAMCNDDGCIIDDGIVVKREENEYYFTTSTVRAGATVEWIRYHTRYDGWNFNMVNLTDAFGVINLAGPRAREVLEKITDADVSNSAFPFGGYREFKIIDRIPVRAMRLGFVGELSYELHVPASYMHSLWNTILEAGKNRNIQNFGLEAQNVLRMEKGHLIIGSESEQRTTLHDVGLGFLWDRKKPEAKTVGAPALQQTEHQQGRLKLVGFKMDDSDRAPKDGSLVVDGTIRGRICIARFSFTLNKVIGMALVDDQLASAGTRLSIYEDGCNGQLLNATVAPMPFYDPAGERLRM